MGQPTVRELIDSGRRGEVLPWTLSATDPILLANTGEPVRWDCRVKSCDHYGTAGTDTRAGFMAARHTAQHTEDDVASTGYRTGPSWTELAAQGYTVRLAGHMAALVARRTT